MYNYHVRIYVYIYIYICYKSMLVQEKSSERNCERYLNTKLVKLRKMIVKKSKI